MAKRRIIPLDQGEGSSVGNDSTIILGTGVSNVLLESRAIPDGFSPKRKLNWSPTTPRGSRGGARKFSLSEASPTLRGIIGQKVEVKNKVNWLSKFNQVKDEDQDQNKPKLSDKKKKMVRRNDRRIAANLWKLDLKDQPRIDHVLKDVVNSDSSKKGGLNLDAVDNK